MVKNLDEDFDVVVGASNKKDSQTDTIVDYSAALIDYDNMRIYSAVKPFDEKKQIFSSYPKDATTAETVTIDRLEELTANVNSNVDSLQSLNAIVRQKVLLNDLLGKTVESIFANVNTDFQLNFPIEKGRNKKKAIESAEPVVRDFLDQINIEALLRDAITVTYLEGNRYYYLKIDDGNYVIDKLPVGICYVSDYEINGKPALEINIKKLETSLKKTYQKNKQKKEIWMKDVKDEIKRNYPYLYKEYEAGETYFRTDPLFGKAIRVNNLGRKFGVSPLAKVLSNVIVLDNMSKADITTSQMKQRTIVAQILRKEVLGPNGDKKGIALMEYAHQAIMAALATKSCVYTAPAFVEKVEYVTPPKDENSVDKMATYIKRIFSGLGIGYVDTEAATATGSKISLEELMRTIDDIAEQLESILNDYFKIVLKNNNIDPIYCPKIKIMDSKAMEMAMRKDLAEFVYSKLNSSLRTAYDIIGIDFDSEVQRRNNELEDNIEEVFTPHATSYNKSSDTPSSGRPAADNPDNQDKQTEDKVNNETK